MVTLRNNYFEQITGIVGNVGRSAQKLRNWNIFALKNKMKSLLRTARMPPQSSLLCSICRSERDLDRLYDTRPPRWSSCLWSIMVLLLCDLDRLSDCKPVWRSSLLRGVRVDQDRLSDARPPRWSSLLCWFPSSLDSDSRDPDRLSSLLVLFLSLLNPPDPNRLLIPLFMFGVIITLPDPRDPDCLSNPSSLFCVILSSPDPRDPDCLSNPRDPDRPSSPSSLLGVFLSLPDSRDPDCPSTSSSVLGVFLSLLG